MAGAHAREHWSSHAFGDRARWAALQTAGSSAADCCSRRAHPHALQLPQLFTVQGSSEGSFQPAGAPFPGHVETMSDLGRLSEQDLAAMAGALIQGTAPAQLLSTGARPLLPSLPRPCCGMHITRARATA